jgi:hypothetical protein
MMAYLLLRLVLLIVGIALIVRVWRASAPHAILSMIIPGYVIVPMVKYWKEPNHDIRWHVALLFICAMTAVWLQNKTVREYQAEQATSRQQLAAVPDESADEASDAVVDASAAPDDSDDGDPLHVEHPEKARAAQARTQIEIDSTSLLRGHGPLVRLKPTATPAPADVFASPRPAAVAPPPESSAPTRSADSVPEVPLTFARASAEAHYVRGRLARDSMGLILGLPDHFHALGSVDTRRIETSLGQPLDEREIAWVLHESVPLSDSAGWHVRVRWLKDGWVAATAIPDVEHLLRVAQQGGAGSPRLVGSGGDLLGYAVAPSFTSGVADWVEERLPDGAAASVLDCHAVRLGRTGVLEFSIVGAPAGSQALCDASVRLLARRAAVDHGAEYSSAVAADAVRAPYSLAQLITQRQ